MQTLSPEDPAPPGVSCSSSQPTPSLALHPHPPPSRHLLPIYSALMPNQLSVDGEGPTSELFQWDDSTVALANTQWMRSNPEICSRMTGATERSSPSSTGMVTTPLLPPSPPSHESEKAPQIAEPARPSLPLGCEALSELSTHRTIIGRQGFQPLLSVIEWSRHYLERLDLSGSRLDNECIRQLARLLASGFPRLKVVDLRNNPFTYRAAKYLSWMCEGVSSFGTELKLADAAPLPLASHPLPRPSPLSAGFCGTSISTTPSVSTKRFTGGLAALSVSSPPLGIRDGSPFFGSLTTLRGTTPESCGCARGSRPVTPQDSVLRVIQASLRVGHDNVIEQVLIDGSLTSSGQRKLLQKRMEQAIYRRERRKKQFRSWNQLEQQSFVEFQSVSLPMMFQGYLNFGLTPSPNTKEPSTASGREGKVDALPGVVRESNEALRKSAPANTLAAIYQRLMRRSPPSQEDQQEEVNVSFPFSECLAIVNDEEGGDDEEVECPVSFHTSPDGVQLLIESGSVLTSPMPKTIKLRRARSALDLLADSLHFVEDPASLSQSREGDDLFKRSSIAPEAPTELQKYYATLIKRDTTPDLSRRTVRVSSSDYASGLSHLQFSSPYQHKKQWHALPSFDGPRSLPPPLQHSSSSPSTQAPPLHRTPASTASQQSQELPWIHQVSLPCAPRSLESSALSFDLYQGMRSQASSQPPMELEAIQGASEEAHPEEAQPTLSMRSPSNLSMRNRRTARAAEVCSSTFSVERPFELDGSAVSMPSRASWTIAMGEHGSSPTNGSRHRKRSSVGSVKKRLKSRSGSNVGASPKNKK